MGHIGVGVGWVMKGCHGSCRGGVGHEGVVMGHEWVGVGWFMKGWGGLVHEGVRWVM